MINVYVYEVEKQSSFFHNTLDNVLTFNNYDIQLKCDTTDIDILKKKIEESFRSGIYFLSAQGQTEINLAEYIREKDKNSYIIFYSINLNSYVFSVYNQKNVYKIKGAVLKKYIQFLIQRAYQEIEHKESKRKDLLRFKVFNTNYTLDFKEIVSLFVNPQNERKLTLYGISTIKDFPARLEDFERQFDKRFFKLSSTVIVNLDMVIKFEADKILLQNQQVFQVSGSVIKRMEFKHYMRKLLKFI